MLVAANPDGSNCTLSLRPGETRKIHIQVFPWRRGAGAAGALLGRNTVGPAAAAAMEAVSPQLAELHARLDAVCTKHREVLALRRKEFRPQEGSRLAHADQQLGIEIVDLQDAIARLSGPVAGSPATSGPGEELASATAEQEISCRLWLHNVELDRNEESFIFKLIYPTGSNY